MKLNKFAYLYSKLLGNHTLRTRMHSSRTTCSSSCPGGSPPGTPFCYGLLVWWPSGVMAFCYGLLSPQKTIPEGRLQSEGHQTRRPQQKATPPGAGTHPPGAGTPRAGTPQSRHPQSRHPPEQAPITPIPWSRHPTPWEQTPLETCCKACWDTTCNACWDSTPLLTEWQMPVKI